jgi:hypothetical protein
MIIHRVNKNYNMIKTHYSYTFREIEDLLNVHTRTIQVWRKHGLMVIDESSKPFLVDGIELKRFLKAKKMSKKVKLGPLEFYCTKCRGARQSITNFIKIMPSEKIIGKDKKAVMIRGKCNVCGCNIYRFSSDKKIDDFDKLLTMSSPCSLILIEKADPFHNTDIGGYKNGQYTA